MKAFWTRLINKVRLIYHFIEAKKSLTQNLHVRVVEKRLLNTYVQNQRKHKISKLKYTISQQVVVLTQMFFTNN